MSLFGLGRNQRTFRPKKSAPSGSKGAQLRKHIDATLGSGNLREAVRLPPGEDVNEWLAVNTVDFFNQVNLLYGTLTEFCTPENCPTMTAGPKYEYRWADGVQIKKPIEVSAPKYVEYLMDWIEAQLDDESIFPQKLGAPFPPNFKDVVKTIFKRLFRVYAHIYHSHFQKIVSLKEEAHLNTCFKHFILFTWVSSLLHISTGSISILLYLPTGSNAMISYVDSSLSVSILPCSQKDDVWHSLSLSLFFRL
uniref:MOB kinase activator-like 1A n=1 Tax=Rhizophora mucronata TaxID=61149 RepID=A0A2P2KHZ7_RHIMU